MKRMPSEEGEKQKLLCTIEGSPGKRRIICKFMSKSHHGLHAEGLNLALPSSSKAAFL